MKASPSPAIMEFAIRKVRIIRRNDIMATFLDRLNAIAEKIGADSKNRDIQSAIDSIEKKLSEVKTPAPLPRKKQKTSFIGASDAKETVEE
jgi:hypothetical protein